MKIFVKLLLISSVFSVFGMCRYSIPVYAKQIESLYSICFDNTPDK